MIQIGLATGNIARIPVDAIATELDSSGRWNSEVDRAIFRDAQNMYHGQLAYLLATKNISKNQIIVIQGDTKTHAGKFMDVIFAVNGAEDALSDVVLGILDKAHANRHCHIAIPLLRMWDKRGNAMLSIDDAMRQMLDGINRFSEDHSTYRMKVTIVIDSKTYGRYFFRKVLSEQFEFAR